MSKTNAFETALLALIFNNTAISALPGSLTSLYVSLHTGDPGEAGDQTTSEATYTSYARVAVARTAVGWTVTGNSVSPASAVEFAQATGGSETITHFGVGTASTGAGLLLYKGALAPNVAVSTGVAVCIKTTSTITED